MKIDITNGQLAVWLTKHDTYEWANRPGKRWPCSTLAGKRVYALFAANGDLLDFVVNLGRDQDDIDGNELTAITSDAIVRAGLPDHPAVRNG